MSNDRDGDRMSVMGPADSCGGGGDWGASSTGNTKRKETEEGEAAGGTGDNGHDNGANDEAWRGIIDSVGSGGLMPGKRGPATKLPVRKEHSASGVAVARAAVESIVPRTNGAARSDDHSPADRASAGIAAARAAVDSLLPPTSDADHSPADRASAGIAAARAAVESIGANDVSRGIAETSNDAPRGVAVARAAVEAMVPSTAAADMPRHMAEAPVPSTVGAATIHRGIASNAATAIPRRVAPSVADSGRGIAAALAAAEAMAAITDADPDAIPADDDGDDGDVPAVSRKSRPRHRRRDRPRSKTIALKRLTRDELRRGALANPPIEGIDRPQTRSDCRDAPRPCPWVACKHHLYLDINPRTGSIKINFPDLEPWELQHTCALDVADNGGLTLEEIGVITNLTRERVRQVEVRGLLTLKSRSSSLR